MSLRFAITGLLLTTTFASAAIADEAPAEITPRGTIVDENQKPLSGPQITLHRWDGNLSPALQSATTDAEGHFEFPSRPADAYYYVVIRKPSYASLSQIVGAAAPVKVTLRPAVEGWIEVRSDAGEPLQGARIASLSIRTPENDETFVWRGMEHYFGFEFLPSDKNGRLNLPPLPQGALFDCKIDHPHRAQATLSNATALDGRAGAVALPPGVMTTLQFVADARTPLPLDGLTCQVLLFSQTSDSDATIRLPVALADDRFRLCVHPGTYRFFRLTAEGVAITPNLDRLTIPRDAETTFRFLVRKSVNVSGRVVHRDGTPHKGARVSGQIENLSPEGPVAGAEPWAWYGSAETDAEGKYTLALAPGRSRIEVEAEGFATDRDYAELAVNVVGPNQVADFIVEAIPPVRGRVIDRAGNRVPGAIVRLRHPSMNWKQPVISDADGMYEISFPWIPRDLETRQASYELDVAAFVADQPLAGIAHIDLRRSDALSKADIVLGAESSPDALLSREDNQWSLARKQKVKADQPEVSHPAGERGRPAPELEGVAWFNTDARSLQDFRGRYVLLDFWFTGCGPCHADFPSVKLVHERFEKHGVTVIGVHDNSSTPDAVREHCQKQGLLFPIVVDHPDSRIVNAYRQLGLSGFPSYILVGPDGNSLENDNVTDGPPLRTFKLEIVRKYILFGRE